jgi:hypothetical protein
MKKCEKRKEGNMQGMFPSFRFYIFPFCRGILPAAGGQDYL